MGAILVPRSIILNMAKGRGNEVVCLCWWMIFNRYVVGEQTHNWHQSLSEEDLINTHNTFQLWFTILSLQLFRKSCALMLVGNIRVTRQFLWCCHDYHNKGYHENVQGCVVNCYFWESDISYYMQWPMSIYNKLQKHCHFQNAVIEHSTDSVYLSLYNIFPWCIWWWQCFFNFGKYVVIKVHIYT